MARKRLDWRENPAISDMKWHLSSSGILPMSSRFCPRKDVSGRLADARSFVGGFCGFGRRAGGGGRAVRYTTGTMVSIPYIICSVLSFIPALVLHEVAHGFAAYKLGDPTAKRSGRLSLNPLKHIDPFGTVILPAMLMLMGWPVFGYAKPVTRVATTSSWVWPGRRRTSPWRRWLRRWPGAARGS